MVVNKVKSGNIAVVDRLMGMLNSGTEEDWEKGVSNYTESVLRAVAQYHNSRLRKDEDFRTAGVESVTGTRFDNKNNKDSVLNVFSNESQINPVS